MNIKLPRNKKRLYLPITWCWFWNDFVKAVKWHILLNLSDLDIPKDCRRNISQFIWSRCTTVTLTYSTKLFSGYIPWQLFLYIFLQFSARGANFLLVAQGTALIGEGALIRDGALNSFGTYTSECDSILKVKNNRYFSSKTVTKGVLKVIIQMRKQTP